MRKFWVIFFSVLVVCTLSVSMIYVFSTRETIKISANVMYVNVGDEFELNVQQINKDNSTTISAASSDASIVSFDNGLCVAKTGGVARITFTTSNARYRNLYCDVMVGDGTMANPYYISSAEQLTQIGQPDSPYSVYACYKLVSNIDMSTVNDGLWTPINEFAGRFDGNGYTISNLMIDSSESNEAVENGGLFGKIAVEAAVYNLKLDNIYVLGSYTNAGTIAGINYGVIERVEVINSFIDVDAEAVGGIVGRNITTDSGNLINDRAVAVISKTSANIIIGQERKIVDESVTFVNKGATGIIGGIAGQNVGGEISNTYSTGKVVLGESNIIYGGIVGDNQYTICSTADNSTNSFVAPARVENSYSSVSLFSNKVNNYAIESIGGVVGQNTDILEEVNTNGVVINLNSNNLNGLYYDKNKLNISETSSIKVFDGVGNSYIMVDGTSMVNNATEKAGYVLGCATNTMKARTTYKALGQITEIYDTNGKLISTRTKDASWDFENVWQISESVNGGYPYLTYVYIEEIEDETTTNNSYIILNTYTLTIAQGDSETKKEVKGLSEIVVTNSLGEVVKRSTASSISFDVVEGFRVSTNSKGIVVYDLDGNVHYNITFNIVESNYKFSSIAFDSYISSNNGSIKEDGTVSIWFRNTNHTLTIVDSKTNRTIKTATVAEGASLSTYITSIQNSYNQYDYVRYNTQLNGTGSSYTTTSKMPNKDLTLYVIYSNSSVGSGSNDDIWEGTSPSNPDSDYSEDCYQISSVDDWNRYVVEYGDVSGVKFVQTKSFTITSSFKVCPILAGEYDGNGYTIEVRGSLRKFGLFNSIAKTGSVTNLEVEYSSATIVSVSNSKYFGGIANESKGGTITDCNVSGTINIDNNATLGVAGIVGHLYDGEVMGCNNSADIVAESQIVAGVVASMRKGEVSSNFNSGDITNEASSVNDYDYIQYGTIMASGIVGYMYSTSYSMSVASNENSGSILSQVSGANNGGNSAGIVAYQVSGDVEGNTNEGTINSCYQAGGIVAYVKSGDVTRNTNSGNVIASTNILNSNTAAGGIVGKVSDSGVIKTNTQRGSKVIAECEKLGVSESYAGGIVGCIFYGGTVSNNTMSTNCLISANGAFAYAAGGVGRICEKIGSVSYSGTKYASGWSSKYTKYITADGYSKAYINYDANYNDYD